MPVHEGVRVVWHVPPTLPTIRTDPAKLRIVLDNLVNNAIKFTSRGAITVGARRLVDRDAVEIVVEDTGPGIPKAELARIFEPFHQAAGGQDHPHGGVGLGLAIVERYVRLLGAAIDVESTPAVGTRFTITLPCDGAAITDRTTRAAA
jgi:two-component system sensor histidine kinase ChiS